MRRHAKSQYRGYCIEQRSEPGVVVLAQTGEASTVLGHFGTPEMAEAWLDRRIAEGRLEDLSDG